MTVAQNPHLRRILGINFFVGRVQEAVELGMRGGLVVAPAAPALTELPYDSHYRLALSSADVAITDSSLMVMLWNLTRRDNIIRISGLEYLMTLFQTLKKGEWRQPFFILPSQSSAALTRKWVSQEGFPCAESHIYIAPWYQPGQIVDHELLRCLQDLKPSQIIIALGGGTQEKLGLFLRNQLLYKPGIHCIGAALGFLTGDQVKIPLWADHLYLGWLFRCFHKPGQYIPRYWRARKLFWQLAFQKDSSLHHQNET